MVWKPERTLWPTQYCDMTVGSCRLKTSSEPEWPHHTGGQNVVLGTYSPRGKVLWALPWSGTDKSSGAERHSDTSRLWWPQRWDGSGARAIVPGRTGQEGREAGGGPRRTGEEKYQRYLAKGKAGVSLTWVWQRVIWEPLWRRVFFGQHSVDSVAGTGPYVILMLHTPRCVFLGWLLNLCAPPVFSSVKLE